MPSTKDMQDLIAAAKEKASKRGKSSRRKGICGEQEVIRLLRPILEDAFTAAGREPPRLQRNTLQSDAGGCDLTGLEWLAAEVKVHERADHAARCQWWAQTVAQARSGQMPVLFFRSRRQPWQVMITAHVWPDPTQRLVTMTIEDFLQYFAVIAAQQIPRVAK